jgi:hypothetical protein
MATERERQSWQIREKRRHRRIKIKHISERMTKERRKRT